GPHMAANGVATFRATSIDKAGTGYSLVASSAPLTPVTSGPFNVSAAAATRLVLTTPPSSTAQSGQPLAQQPVVQLQDANGNPVSQSNGVVTATPGPVGTAVNPPPSVIVRDASGNPVSGVAVTFAASPGSGTVTPTTPVATGANGIAAATSWTLSATAGQNTATATATGLAGSPVTFTATGTAGAATRLVLTTPPSSTARSGQALAQQPAVQLQDANGNPVSQSNVVVTATPSPAGATAGNNTA